MLLETLVSFSLSSWFEIQFKNSFSDRECVLRHVCPYARKWDSKGNGMTAAVCTSVLAICRAFNPRLRSEEQFCYRN